MDTLTKRERSRVMARVRAKNTRPELAVRDVVRRLGFTFQLHDKSLPGHPDLVFRRERKAIFIHGCFWHRHACPNGQRLPKSRVRFWQGKLTSNKRRDLRNLRRLNRLGWRYILIWECRLKDLKSVERRVGKFLALSK
jgi:DNA mismatch endonuclease, patch repair protein